MSKPTISLCIISRKEDEDSLRDAVNSVSSQVDEIIIVDTSSGKEKIEPNFQMADGYRYRSDVANSATDITKIIPYAWTNDFAAARNFSFEQATGDVIFWIDSDDIVRNPENLPKLAQVIADKDADWIYCQYEYARDEWGNLTAVHWKPRLFRKGTVKWQKTVHEDTAPIGGVIQVKDKETGEGTIVIEHHPAAGHGEESEERNLAIMMAEYEKDGEATDPRTLQYIAFALEGMQRYAEAIPFYHRHVSKSGSNSDRFWSLQRLSNCLYHVGDSRNAISVCMDALKLYPEWKTAYFRLAEIYYMQGDYDKVVEWTLTGMDKQVPDILDVISEIDYTILPYGRLCESYLYLNQPKFALDMAEMMMKVNPKMPIVKEMYETCKRAVELENFVRAFLTVAAETKKYDRLKTVELFDLIPKELDDDVRIQQARSLLVPPTTWPDKSITIYCGETLEEWAYPSIFSGIGGSEEAVIMISEQLAKKGYSVTVYNRCGSMKGEYNGVTYKPYYHFNSKDNFNVLIAWRSPGVFLYPISAKKKYIWLHDIAHPEQFNQTIYDRVDTVLFLSNWHRGNLPKLPDNKVYITNNGINPDDFQDLPPKKKNSLLWASSYDRGLVPFMEHIWPLIQKEVPDVTIDIAYGTQNIEKEMAELPHLREIYDKCQQIFKLPGVTHHGRLSHKKLAKLMGECMVYPYASEFGETNNITSQKCQAAGCYVITTSQAGGTPERVKFGKVVQCEGIYTNKEAQEKFARKVISYLTHSNDFEIKHSAHRPNIKEITKEFSWETTANSWIKNLL